jgi:hypothetical protein
LPPVPIVEACAPPVPGAVPPVPIGPPPVPGESPPSPLALPPVPGRSRRRWPPGVAFDPKHPQVKAAIRTVPFARQKSTVVDDWLRTGAAIYRETRPFATGTALEVTVAVADVRPARLAVTVMIPGVI